MSDPRTDDEPELADPAAKTQPAEGGVEEAEEDGPLDDTTEEAADGSAPSRR